jgi:hypothetical protein
VGTMRRVRRLIFLVFSLLIVYRVGSSPSGVEAKAFVNGKWFTGQDFESATFYAVDGILTKRKHPGPIETVDLQGAFVVSAFEDAHVHFPSTEQNFQLANRAFLRAGAFYVLNAGGKAETEPPALEARHASHN